MNQLMQKPKRRKPIRRKPNRQQSDDKLGCLIFVTIMLFISWSFLTLNSTQNNLPKYSNKAESFYASKKAVSRPAYVYKLTPKKSANYYLTKADNSKDKEITKPIYVDALLLVSGDDLTPNTKYVKLSKTWQHVKPVKVAKHTTKDRNIKENVFMQSMDYVLGKKPKVVKTKSRTYYQLVPQAKSFSGRYFKLDEFNVKLVKANRMKLAQNNDLYSIYYESVNN